MERVFQNQGTPTLFNSPGNAPRIRVDHSAQTAAFVIRPEVPFHLRGFIDPEGVPRCRVIPAWVNDLEPHIGGTSIHANPYPALALGSGENHIWLAAIVDDELDSPTFGEVTSAEVGLHLPTPETPRPDTLWTEAEKFRWPLQRLGVVDVETTAAASFIRRVRNEWSSSINFVLFFHRWVATGAAVTFSDEE